MIKHVGSLLFILLSYAIAFCQDEITQRPTLGIHFIFDDFKTAYYMRLSSLRQVLRNGQFGRMSDMMPGLALSYTSGLSPHFDFTSTLTGAYLDYNRNDGSTFGQEHLLMEGDVGLRGKLLTNRYLLSPFLQIGTGFSIYNGYWGAIMPLGGGLQFNLFGEAYFILHAQYRIAVTNPTNSDHFFYGIGIAGNIGRRKGSVNNSVLPND